MAKIVIIAPEEADDDVKDAVKLLKAAGHDVDTDEPTPKALIHIVLGLLGPNAYGFGPGYGFVPGGSGAAQDDDNDTSGANDEGSGPTEEPEEEAAGGADEFNFESLGTVTVDGELMEAVTVDSDTSFLCVEGLQKGGRTTYKLNESMFSFWPANPAEPTQRVDIMVEKHRTSIELALQESDKPALKVGRDLIDMFETKRKPAESSDDDDDISVKVGQHVKNIQPMRAGKAYANFGSPAKMGDEGKVTKVNNLRDVTIVQFKKNDGSEVYTHVQNLK